jgi:3-isopropylmalate dehydrogenase
MMLEHLGEEAAGKTVEKAVMEITGKHIKSLAAGNMGMSTTEVGDLASKLASTI